MSGSSMLRLAFYGIRKTVQLIDYSLFFNYLKHPPGTVIGNI